MGYDSATALAKRLLGAKGASVTLTRPGQGAANAITGRRDTGPDDEAVFNCVGLPPGPSATKEIGTLVNRNVQEFHLARTGGDLDPQPGDRIEWKGADWVVIWAAVYDPDGSGMVYAKAYAERGG